MRKQLFNRDWRVAEGYIRFGSAMNTITEPELINLPHDGTIAKKRTPDAATWAHGGFVPGTILTYIKDFDAPMDWQGKHIEIEFEGVYMCAEILLNDDYSCQHPYGYTGFSVDLTDYIKYGEKNTLIVVARNDAAPNSRWYSGMGIYRNVWLSVSEASYIKPWSLRITTPVAEATGANSLPDCVRRDIPRSHPGS